MKNIAKDLKNNSLKPFYLLYGEEKYLLNYYKNEFKKKFSDNGDMNKAIFTKENYNLSKFIDVVYKMPFFSDKKLIVLDNVVIDGANESKKEENGEGRDVKEKRTIYDILLDNVEINVVLFVYSNSEKVDKRSKLYKFLNENGYVCELNTQDDETIIKFIKNILSKDKKQISTKDASYIILKVGKSLDDIVNELDKLVAYVGNRDEITKDDIDKVVHEALENRVFSMIKCLNNNDLKNAYDIYADLLLGDTSSNKSIIDEIIRLFKYNYNLILSLKSLKARGKNMADIRNMLNVQDWQLKNISEVERSHDEKYFTDKILRLCEYNKKMRHDQINKNVVIELLMN